MSITEPVSEDDKGATYQVFFLKKSKIFTSIFCAIKKARPEPIAIRTDIISSKFVDTNSVREIPMTKPIRTIFLATIFP